MRCSMRDPHVHLTEEEQRQLHALEAEVRRDDPRFDRRLRHGHRLPFVGLVVIGWPLPSLGTGLALVVVGMGAMVWLVTINPLLAFVAYLPMLLGTRFLLDTPTLRRAAASLLDRHRTEH